MNLVSSMEGGLSYTELRNMPIPELKAVQEDVDRISDYRKRQMEKATR